MVHVSSALRWKCPDKGCLIDQPHEISMWDSIGEQFDRGIHPTDIDGFVEVKNSFLVLEQKGRKGLWDSTKGQGKSLVALSCYPAITLIVFVPDYRETSFDIHYREYTLGVGTAWQSIKFNTFLGRIREWFLLADNPTKEAHKTHE